MQERDTALWARVRCAYKAAPDAVALAAEMPGTHVGVLLLKYLRGVRKVARKASVFRADDKNVCASLRVCVCLQACV